MGEAEQLSSIKALPQQNTMKSSLHLINHSGPHLSADFCSRVPIRQTGLLIQLKNKPSLRKVLSRGLSPRGGPNYCTAAHESVSLEVKE